MDTFVGLIRHPQHLPLSLYGTSTLGTGFGSWTLGNAIAKVQEDTGGLYIDGNSLLSDMPGPFFIGSIQNQPMLFGTNNVETVRITGAGSVGIGTTGPLDKLQVVGDLRVGTSGSNGCLKDFGGGTISGTCSSDARLKRDFKPLGPVSEKLSRISPKYYYWRKEEYPNKHFDDQEELGLVAQDLLNIIPEIVQFDEDGFYRIKYQQLPFYLLKGFSEQHGILKEVLSEIATLKKENIDLKKRLEALEFHLSCRKASEK